MWLHKTKTLLGFLTLSSSVIYAQKDSIENRQFVNEELLKRIEELENKQNPKKTSVVDFYGFIRTDFSYDSRQVAYTREYLMNLYPLDEKLDANGDDINASGGSNFLAIGTRLGARVSGPEIWGAKSYALAEADFVGNTEINRASGGSGTIGMLRLRQAHFTLAWQKTSLNVGQSWYPAVIPEVMPSVADFNAGVMFTPFGWGTQIRVNQQFNTNITASITAYKDREFPTATAGGAYTNSASLNSSIPIFNAQIQFKNEHIITGIGGEYQSLKPVTESNNLKSSNKVNAGAGYAYFRYSDSKFIGKFYGMHGGNLHHYVMNSGFGGYLSDDGTEAYKPVRTTSLWTDFSAGNAKITPGIFFGYTKNHGAGGDISNLYMRGGNARRVLDNVWRASGRVEFKQNKFNLAPEVEYTAAKWADTDSNGAAGGNGKSVGSLRILARAIYSF